MSLLKVNNLTDLGDDPVVTDGALVGAGKILQVVSATKTDTFSTTSTSLVDVPDLTVTLTPSATSSKVLISTQIHAGFNDFNFVRFSILRNSTPIAQGSSGTSANDSIIMYITPGNIQSGSISFLDSPATTSSTTYKIQMAVFANTGYVNRYSTDTQLNAVSSITAMEVAG